MAGMKETPKEGLWRGGKVSLLLWKKGVQLFLERGRGRGIVFVSDQDWVGEASKIGVKKLYSMSHREKGRAPRAGGGGRELGKGAREGGSLSEKGKKEGGAFPARKKTAVRKKMGKNRQRKGKGASPFANQ